MQNGRADAYFIPQRTVTRTQALRHDLHLLDARYGIWERTKPGNNENLYEYLKDKVEIIFNNEVSDIEKLGDTFT